MNLSSKLNLSQLSYPRNQIDYNNLLKINLEKSLI